MKKPLLIACAAALTAAQFFPAALHAQPVTRVKARLSAFDGGTMTLEPLPSQPPAAKPDDGALTVAVTPETRFVASEKSTFGAIQAGDYVGAAVTEGRGGTLQAQDVYRYADALRGTGEGRFPEGSRLLVNGTVSKLEPGGKPDGGTVTLHYRGAVLNTTGKGRTVCEGRATPAPFASALACSADAVVEIAPGTPVTALTMGDRSLLVPGSIVTVSITRLADRTIAPGVIVEKPQSPQ